MNQQQHIDLNCDLGEGVGNEEALMPYISSCNLACGGHAGDAVTIKKVAELAKKFAVGVGAHPSFPDRENFGRIKIEIPFEELKHSLSEQIGLVAEACANQNLPVHHIKLHGALYNLCATDTDYAEAMTDFLAENYSKIPVYVPYNSVMHRVANGRLKLIFEAFADRNYEADGSLVSRSKNNAMITDKNQLADHVIRLVKKGEIQSVSGGILKRKADTICVHGDTPKAVELLSFLTQKLVAENIQIKTV
ncbi:MULTISPECIES: 5-oxoprolinase subunit PxpA [unclassified Leeuwenhoekiella]|uniref:5-oxoprolinase subunit PxpA n=1 Tax=unclassified Leeuwenhoekiella TaxID=2615029 RepID=UPI000C5C4E89|nr:MULTISPECIES: 5-oxoprolinase subunit PxpA [unclassified Leeuwenhoekiella]MAW94511.1 lactam utilization protein LamB [Leeuwenhoekiella sp.]MBA81934.1 lactam utilization protein LamB [Leeuwenhoekiella sp.]|tara:strand:- start:215 stop:961 length:747 start_codon:yes stop_codon:yes gene_type:complete